MSEQEINTTIQNLVKHGFGRQQAIDVYFSANPNAKRDPNASYNFEDVSSAVEAAVKKHHHEIPAHVKETDSDDDYGSIVSMVMHFLEKILSVYPSHLYMSLYKH